MVFANISNSKVIYYETESDGAPFVAPEARHGESLVVAGSMEDLGEDIIGKISILRKTIDALAYIKVHPNVARKIMEIVFVNEFFWDNQKAYTRELAAIKRGAQIKVENIKGG